MPLLAYAQDLTPITDRILSDPTYLPSKGQIYGETDYDYGSTTSDAFNTSGDRTAHDRTSTDTITQHVAYGLTDRLSFNFSIDYQAAYQHDTSASGVLTDLNSRGFADPTFGVAYRLIDQTDHPFTLDAKASYAPDVFTARDPAPGVDGTIATGGQQADFGLSLGHETRFFTLQGTVSARYVGPTDAENQYNGGAFHTSSYWVPTLAVASQTRLTNRISFNVGGNYNFNGSPDVYNSFTGNTYQSNRGDYGQAILSLNYHFIPNALVGSLGYTHTFYGHTDNAFSYDPSLDTTVTRSTDTFGATLRYVFR